MNLFLSIIIFSTISFTFILFQVAWKYSYLELENSGSTYLLCLLKGKIKVYKNL